MAAGIVRGWLPTCKGALHGDHPESQHAYHKCISHIRYVYHTWNAVTTAHPDTRTWRDAHTQTQTFIDTHRCTIATSSSVRVWLRQDQVHTQIDTDTQRHTHLNTCIHTHRYTHSNTHRQLKAHPPRHTCTRIYPAHTHTHAHTHYMYTYKREIKVFSDHAVHNLSTLTLSAVLMN